jgi:DNA-binding NarL/FixJ family response regulator
METTTIVIAEDHPLILKGIKNIIRQIKMDVEFFETDNGADLLNLAKQHQPQFCIIDLNLTDGIAITSIESLTKLFPEVNILIYTSLPDPMYAKHLFRIGIHGFLNKRASEDELRDALTKFLNEEFFVSSEFLPRIFNQAQGSKKGSINPFELLSIKELTLIEYLKDGISIKDISEKMAIKSNTAATYKKRAFQKLKIENIIQLHTLYTHHQVEVTQD